MAVAVDNHHHPFKPMTRSHRRHRLLSFPHPDLNLCHILGAPPNLRTPFPPAASPTFHRSLSTPCLSSDKPNEPPRTHNARVEIVMGRKGAGVHALIIEAAIAMASGILPVPAPAGLGGAYYLRNRSGQSFAVLKPANGIEPLGIGRHRCLLRPPAAGDPGVREVAAYLLDHGGFSGVPPTALVKMSHVAFQHDVASAPPQLRIASIQRFVPHSFDAGDFGPSRFSVASVHRIGILDIRILNVDRHSGNILVRRCPASIGSGDGYSNEAAELVPIDHGLCLPELLDDPYFEWLHWPQASVPFSDVEIEYISALDARRDAELLRAELPLLGESSIRILVLCTIFLKKAAAAGLCLADIGDMMTRGFCGTSASRLESICRQVQRSMDDWSSDEEGELGRAQLEEAFQFDTDHDDGALPTAVEDIPVLACARANTAVNSTKGGSVYVLDEEEGDGESGSDDDGPRTWVGSLGRSASFTVVERRHGRRRMGVSFKRMGEKEWAAFLERFEAALAEAVEERRSVGVVRRRLGTSCKF